MFFLFVLAILAVLGLARLLRGHGENDIPARIVTAATNRLPAHLRDWGRAMDAELFQIHGPAHRWRFSAGVLRVALFPPLRQRNHVLVVAFVGLLVAAAATVAAAYEVPSLSVFAAVLGLLLCGYATVVTSRSQRPGRTVAGVIVGAVALAGVAATVAAVVRVAAAHPAATADDTHVFSVLFALVLTGYLALAYTSPRAGNHTNTVLWWGLAGGLISGAIWTVSAVTTTTVTDGVTGFMSPIGAGAVLAVAIGASVTASSRRVGARAGILTAILGAPIHFAVATTAILQLHDYTLTNPYDISAFPHSGYPDAASYVLSDAVAGNIITGLVLYPVALIALALLGAAVGTGLHHLANRRTARPAA
jgi:hypothetical protein